MKSFYLNYLISAVSLLSLLHLIDGSSMTVNRVPTPNHNIPDFCKSPVYCNGPLLHTVQLARIFDDSKTFVDLYQKYEEDVTINNFNRLMNNTRNNPNAEEIRKFVEENFSEVDELEHAELTDWSESPAILDKIKDTRYKIWAKELNDLWKTLAMRIRTDVQDNPKRYSIIYVNNTFIIPGGRFKEFYYWDSYWIIESLLITGLRETAKGMIQNFLSMVDNYGFIPNGGRVYYLMRSQPPLLPQMVQRYYEITKDLDFALAALPSLEAEFKYWHEKKTVLVKKGSDEFLMGRYVVSGSTPRPESYREDYELHEKLKGDERQKYFYENMKAAAETGWDFSARWFSDKGSFTKDILNVSAMDIVPVDLNAFLESNARILSQLYNLRGDRIKAKLYKKISNQYRLAIQNILWNETDGIWYDYNIHTGKQNARFYLSNLTPLFTQSYRSNLSSAYGESTVGYLQRMNVTKIGGIPVSLDNTGQQWDFPNAWSPLMSIAVRGLGKADCQAAKHLSQQLAATWLRSNYEGFASKNKAMFEKYTALELGSSGAGGEYEPQTGFGWSNGVVLQFLDMYPTVAYRYT